LKYSTHFLTFVLLFTFLIVSSCSPDNNNYSLNDGVLNLNLSKTNSDIPEGTTKISMLFKSFSNTTFQTRFFNGDNVEFNIEIKPDIYKLYIACFNSNNELLGIYYNKNFEIYENIPNNPNISISKLEFKLENLKSLNPSYKNTVTLNDNKKVKFFQKNANLEISAINLIYFFKEISGNINFVEYYKHETWDDYYGINFSSYLNKFVKKDSNEKSYINYSSNINFNKITLQNILILNPISYIDIPESYPSGKNYIILESEELHLGETKFFIRFNLEY
jgi:hypothetical protein